MTIAGRLTYNYNRELLNALPGLSRNILIDLLAVLLRFSHKHLVFNLVIFVHYFYFNCDSHSVCTPFTHQVKRWNS